MVGSSWSEAAMICEKEESPGRKPCDRLDQWTAIRAQVGFPGSARGRVLEVPANLAGRGEFDFEIDSASMPLKLNAATGGRNYRRRWRVIAHGAFQKRDG